MANWSDSYLGKLRQVVGDRLLLLFGARVIIEDNLGRVLLQKRSDFKLWGLPGGCPEVGESAEDCSAREVFDPHSAGISGEKIIFSARRTKKLENPSSFVSKIGNVLKASDRYQMNRHETLKHPPHRRRGSWFTQLIVDGLFCLS
ncbi:NUDIX domain-containing protein [Nostoc sp. TCL240-02]|nr:NUDIX domain-containing protein [Nostoc sp. TCL240-02]